MEQQAPRANAMSWRSVAASKPVRRRGDASKRHKTRSDKPGAFKRASKPRDWRTKHVPFDMNTVLSSCRKSVFDLVDGSKGFRELKDGLKKLQKLTAKRYGNDARLKTALKIAAVHRLSEIDDLRMCESVLLNATKEECEVICNTKLGRSGYTPLFRAAYKGSIRMIKLLCGYGADVSMLNSHGETVLVAVRQGRNDHIALMPAQELFIAARYDECKAFVQKKMEKPVVLTKIRPRMPRRIHIAGIRIKWWYRWRKRVRMMKDAVASD